MKNKKFLTEADRRNIISEREKTILENFSKTFKKIKRIDEAYGMSFEEAKAEAKKTASEDGVAQHVNKIGDDLYTVSDFLDGDNTVASFGLGIDENDSWEEEQKKKQLQQTLQQSHGSKPSDEEMSNVMSMINDKKINEYSDDDELDDEEIKLFQFSSEFIDIINGVAKTKNDLKNLAGATFGGASENYYSRLSIALNDFYKNIYKPIEAKYIEDMAQEDKSRRRLYPQNYENK